MTYNAQRIGEFASKLEKRVFETLKQYKPIESTLHTQHKVLIKPATKRYSPIYWRIDFKLQLSEFNYLLIEAKGFQTREFKRTIQYFEYFNPDDFNRLIFVVDRPEVTKIKGVEKILGTNDLLSYLYFLRVGQTWNWQGQTKKQKGEKNGVCRKG